MDTPEGDWYAVLFQDHGAVGAQILVELCDVDLFISVGNIYFLLIKQKMGVNKEINPLTRLDYPDPDVIRVGAPPLLHASSYRETFWSASGLCPSPRPAVPRPSPRNWHVEVRMQPGDEDKEFTILGFGGVS